MIITKEVLKEGKSKNGGWSNKQMYALGVTKDQIKVKGWMDQLIGQQVPFTKVAEFIRLKDQHIKNNKTKGPSKQDKKVLNKERNKKAKVYLRSHKIEFNDTMDHYQIINLYLDNGGLMYNLMYSK